VSAKIWLFSFLVSVFLGATIPLSAQDDSPAITVGERLRLAALRMTESSDSLSSSHTPQPATTSTIKPAGILQLYISLTPEGGSLKLPPGTYAGPAIIDKAIILDGGHEVIFDGGGVGTVLTLRADSIEVRNLRLTGSGISHDRVDAALLIESNGCLVENLMIDNVLFGVHLQAANGNIIRRNQIGSLVRHKTLRGDPIRLWNSRNNRVEENEIAHARDVVLTNSPHNSIRKNSVMNCRMGIELIFSPSCEIAGNRFEGNEQGVVGIYSDSLYIHHNQISHQDKLRGSALAVKGSSVIRVEHNFILGCAVGLTANSPIFPENILYLRDNIFAYNDIAMFFYGDRGGHVIHGNHFVGNFQQVAVTGPSSAIENDWLGNYWQDYTGFDLNEDGVGDTPYSVYLHSDRLWMERSMVRFFRGSPLFETIDFAERLAPFLSAPLILQDEKPMMRVTARAMKLGSTVTDLVD
jgi:nitrous oxidase accessory protein